MSCLSQRVSGHGWAGRCRESGELSLSQGGRRTANSNLPGCVSAETVCRPSPTLQSARREYITRRTLQEIDSVPVSGCHLEPLVGEAGLESSKLTGISCGHHKLHRGTVQPACGSRCFLESLIALWPLVPMPFRPCLRHCSWRCCAAMLCVFCSSDTFIL